MYLSKLKYENRHSTNISDVSHLLDNIITLLWGNKNFCDRIKYLWKYPFRENRLSFHASYEIVISYPCPTWHLKWTCAFPKKKNRRVLENDISFQYPTSVVITKIQEWLKYYILELYDLWECQRLVNVYFLKRQRYIYFVLILFPDK